MTTERGLRTKHAICDATLKLLESKGYDAVTVAEICREAEVSNGSFFHHFNAKDDVLVEIARGENEALELFYDHLDTSDASEAFRKIINWQSYFYMNRGSEFIAHLHAHLILLGDSAPFRFSLGKVLGLCIAQGQNQGAMRADINADELGELFMNDLLALTSGTSWKRGDRSIRDRMRERGELYLSICKSEGGVAGAGQASPLLQGGFPIDLQVL